MRPEVLLYASSAIAFVWGIAHIAPTRSVVRGFEPLTRDNRLVLTMEWVAEGLILVFMGVLVGVMTAMVGVDDRGAVLAYRACAAMLVVLAAWTAITGARTAVVMFKICPIVKTTAAVLLVIGSGG